MDIVSGIVHRITYQNIENGYCVLKIKPKLEATKALFDVETDADQTITVTGSLLIIKKDEEVDFWGKWENHTKYGTFLNVAKFHIHPPTSLEGIERFLATDHFKGIGPKTAQALIKKFKERLPEIIENTPSELKKIKGITSEKVELIHQSWMKAKSIRDEMIALQGLGLTPHLSQKIIEQYPGKALDTIRNNPYQLAADLWGVGFVKADEIAKDIGFTNDHPFRIQAGINYALLKAMEDGHTYLPQQELLVTSGKLLGVNEDQIVDQLKQLISHQLLMKPQMPDEPIYLKEMYEQEKEIAKISLDLVKKNKSNTKIDPRDLKKDIQEFENNTNITLAHEQKQAIEKTFLSPMTILTGGPGTGKSTTVNSIVSLAYKHNLRIALAAPTGRAAKRLEEITKSHAYTIHRLLKLTPGEIAYYNQGNPLPFDVVVIDEVSMLDTFLALFVLRAIEPGTHLLLVGDSDQLPSVQAGNILADLINCKQFPVIKLNTIFRQAQQSAIIRNAHKIREGEFPELPKHPTDFYFFSTETPEEALETVVDLVTKRIPKEFKFNPLLDIQVMAPLYKTTAGVNAINQRIQEVLNPASYKKNEVKYGMQILREGDRVMQLKNDYDKEVYNGDIGTITGVEVGKNTMVTVSFSDSRTVIFQDEEIKELTLAYAVSVHKSQGSEFSVVVMPVLTSHYIMLQRNLLYTGVTRAKKLVILVGQKRAIFIALQNDKPQKRYSGLCFFLTEK